MTKFAAALALGLAATAATAAPPAWTVVPAKSRIAFSGQHAGNAFTGTFGQWTAQVRFDPADLAHSSATVTIATASAKTGDSFRDTSLTGAEWFAPSEFPRATFATTRIAAAGPGRYVADGTITIKGKATPVKLPFTLKIAGNNATMAGSTTVDRLALGMGAKSDPSGAWVSKAIKIDIQLTATKAK